jgi:hypothetical protein
MEKHLALVNKNSKMVENIIIVDSYDNSSDWENDSILAIADEEHTAILYGSWDGENFIPPTNEKLIELGILKPIEEEGTN